MKPFVRFLIAATITLRAGADPLGEYLYPPDLVHRAQEEIALTDAQRQALQQEAEKAGARFKELQERLQKETDALTGIVKPARVDAAAAIAQLDRLLDAERDMKRAQIGFLVSIKNQLTAEQQLKLDTFRKAQNLAGAPNEELRKRLTEKTDRVRRGVEKLVGGGGDPAPIVAIMEGVRPLMEQGRHKEAEAAIDRALKALGEEK